MAYSIVSIANMALSHIAANSRLESLTEDNIAASEVNLWYDHCRLLTLKEYNWNFARRRTAPALHSEAAPAGWFYRYQLRQLRNRAGDRERR